MYHPQPLLRAQQPALLHRKAANAAPKSSSRLAFYLTAVVLVGCGATQFFLLPKQQPAGSADSGRSTVASYGRPYATVEASLRLEEGLLIRGFDGVTFESERRGEWVLLHDAGGWKVDISASGETVSEGELPKHTFVRSVRLYSPEGDMVSCTLPSVAPNTSQVHVVAMPVNSVIFPTMLSPDTPTGKAGQLKAHAILKQLEGTQTAVVAGCQIEGGTRIVATAQQVFGYEAALVNPLQHGWAAPFTWLHLRVELLEPLEPRIKGTLGDTFLKPS